MTVWPYLLAGCAATALFNWRAALAIAFCVVLVRVTLPLGHLSFFAIYSCIGALTFFLLDRVAGVALCCVALLIVAHLFGVIGYSSKTIAAEVVLVLGMLASAYTGPSGGILARADAVRDGGLDRLGDRSASVSARGDAAL